jgi:polyisoprenoid-binding protein YceI
MAQQTATSEALTAGTWTVDQAHSEVGFTVRHLGLSKVRGRFNSFSAAVEVAEDLAASSVSATVDLSSVDTNQADRDAHLKTTDFFDIEANPQMVFTSTSVADDTLEGDLTLNGITRPVTFDLDVYGVTDDGYGVTRAGFGATGSIRRSDFGIDFNMPVGLDGMLVSDKVAIELEIQIVPVES